jgi:small conductance mechanosensitive channel
MNTGFAFAALGDTIVTLVSTWGLRLLGAFVAFIVGRIVAGWIRRLVGEALSRTKIEQTLVPFLASLVYYAALTFVLIAVLGIVGIETASLAVVLGAMGFAVGLALQGTLGNFASGVMLMIFRPIRLGDFVEIAGESGTVQDIGVFSTTLNTTDNIQIVLPNSGVYGQTIRNFSANETRRVDLVIGIGYEDDIALAIETVQRVVTGDERVLDDPEPVIAVHELADSSVNLVVRPWCGRDDYWVTRWDLTRAIKEELEKAGCTIPYPQQDVHFHGVGGETLGESGAA